MRTPTTTPARLRPVVHADALTALTDEMLERNPGFRASWLDFEAALQGVPQVRSPADSAQRLSATEIISHSEEVSL